MTSSNHRLTTADFTTPALLLALSVIPTIGAIMRLMSVAGDTAVTPDNARFLHAPAVLLHAVSATLYCLIGAFQFTRGIRIRWPAWHRRAGRVLALAGLVTGVSGLWMTLYYPIPPSLQGHILFGVRLTVGSAMIAAIVIAWSSILQRRVARHEAFMIRAYALGQGAGTQALVMLPWTLITGESGGLTRDLLMTLAWTINLIVSECIIKRRPQRLAQRPGSSVDRSQASIAIVRASP